VRRLVIGLTAALLIGAVAVPALASKPLLEQDPPVEYGHKITICHATSASVSNPAQWWEIITVDVASSGGNGINKALGHVRHIDEDYAKKNGRLDVIPEFDYGDHHFDGNSNPGSQSEWDEWSKLSEENGEAALACVGEPDGEGGAG